RNPTEQWIAGIWAELLDTNTISIHDNFFDLGGHSLLAARLVAYARAHFRVDVDLQSFFLTPTIAGLAEFIETAMTRPRSAHNTTVRMRALVNGLSDEVVESLLADPLLDGGLGVRS
ncbi:MAG: hypothetical protein J2P15_16215, partial [Micromonosporaceae bacterium]|nr:hypothetical protein [Micromonosporaceae bacterium]